MITSQLEIIEQAKRFLGCLSDQQYTHVARPLFGSSAGAHVRHIIDHYLALMHKEGNIVNYNVRHRFSDVENSISDALKQLESIISWLNSLDETTLNMPVEVISEISVSEQQDFSGHSTFGRELVFISSHAVHHFFTLKLIAKVQGIKLDAEFGLAPATATYQRSQIAS
jgi:hypothetical protein